VRVTAPASLHVPVASEKRGVTLAAEKTAIAGETHLLQRDKRGSLLALCLERLEALAGRFQRNGLGAARRPPEEIGCFFAGARVARARFRRRPPAPARKRRRVARLAAQGGTIPSATP
jgi:ATP-dependent Lhr-like helicase